MIIYIEIGEFRIDLQRLRLYIRVVCSYYYKSWSSVWSDEDKIIETYLGVGDHA